MVRYSLRSFPLATIGTHAASNATLSIKGFRDSQSASSEEGIKGGLDLSPLVVVRDT
jgi:hypothetical protein